MLPFVEPAVKPVIEAIVNYSVARFSAKPDAADRIASVAITALEQMGMDHRASMEALVRISENSRGNAKNFVSPIGETCLTVQIGREDDGAIQFDQQDRNAIEFEPKEIGETGTYNVLITELDLQNKTCKLNVQGESEDKRIAGEITDPAITMPNNKYSLALSQKQWIQVAAKPEIVGGEVAKLYISDTV
jgi:hypothetical protein